MALNDKTYVNSFVHGRDMVKKTMISTAVCCVLSVLAQFVNQSLVNTGSVLSHSFSNHLRHFVTRDVTVALEGRVAITFDNAISSQLAYSVICPMISRNIGERICSSESRACSTNNQSGRQSGYESLLHEKLLLQINRINIRPEGGIEEFASVHVSSTISIRFSEPKLY